MRLAEALAASKGVGPRGKLAASIFPPVRVPTAQSWGNTGSVPAWKAGGSAAFESRIERDFYLLMEWDYTVDTFVEQPFKVPYELPSGRTSHYTPDCFVISSDLFLKDAAKYAPTAFEIKSKQELDEEWSELKPKLRAARSFLAESGFRFRLLTEDRINPIFLRNIEFLLSYRGPSFALRTPAEGEIVTQLMWHVHRADEFTPRYLLDKAANVAPREVLIPWLWNLYADYVIQCDLLTPLSLDTVSWQVGDAGAGFANSGHFDYRPDWRKPEHDWRR